MFKKLFTLAISILFCGSLVSAAVLTVGNTWSVGTTAEGLELNSNALTPGTDDDIDLGSSTYEFKDLYITGTANIDTLAADVLTVSGDVTATGILNTGSSVVMLFSSKTTSITPTTTFVIVTSTDLAGNTTRIKTTPGSALISTASASVGDWLVITSTAKGTIQFPVGASHYVVAPSSPGHLATNDTMSLIFDGNYWVQVSSSVNN